MIFDGCLNSNLASWRSKQRPINLATHPCNLVTNPSNSHIFFLVIGRLLQAATYFTVIYKACQFVNYGFLLDESFVSTYVLEARGPSEGHFRFD
jgi:hypothetical protein